MIEVELTAAHMALFKRHRFFAQWRPNFAAYEADDKNGWLRPGLVLRFSGKVEIEPYCGIYQGRYEASAGQMHSHGLCSMGSGSYSFSPLPEAMRVGRHCSIAARLKTPDSQHPVGRVTTGHFSWKPNAFIDGYFEDRALVRPRREPFNLLNGKAYPIVEHDVWIGQDVTLSPGITIGTGAVIAANSVVTKSVPPYEIWGGNPARKIKDRFPPEIRERFLASNWWAYDWKELADISMVDPEGFLDAFERRKPGMALYAPPLLILPDALLAANSDGSVVAAQAAE